LPKICSTSACGDPPSATLSISSSRARPTIPVRAVATTVSCANTRKLAIERKYLCCHEAQKYTITANIVPVWSITRRRVISGVVGSTPIIFSATMTWAELEIGNSSQRPCIAARTRICSNVTSGDL
jgi:hypothetical protein